MEGTQFPKGLKLVQQKNKHYIQYAWQPSLVLGGLGRARLVPIAREGSSLDLALQPTKAYNKKAHRLGVSTERT